MKKVILSLLVVSTAFLYTGCKKDDDTTPPEITIEGNNPDFNILKFTYVDDEATTDDGSTVTTSGTVDVNTVGTYVLTYSATDGDGNSSEEDRTVYVLNMSGTGYAATDSVINPPSFGTYSENITVTNTNINFSKFANYINGAVNGTISGNNSIGYSIDIPAVTVMCGNPAANRTFQGSGSISFVETNGVVTRQINLTYTETTNGSTVDGIETYTK